MIFCFLLKDGCEGGGGGDGGGGDGGGGDGGGDDDDDDDDDDGEEDSLRNNLEVDMKMIIQEDGWVTPKILRDVPWSFPPYFYGSLTYWNEADPNKMAIVNFLFSWIFFLKRKRVFRRRSRLLAQSPRNFFA